MDWKTYKSLPSAAKRNDSYYIIGLDIGNDSSGIAFYNVAAGESEAIDLSGGYGKPSIPTVAQYIADTNEWVFGEYAVLNRGMGTEITLGELVAQLGNFEHIDIGRPVSVAYVLALFIKELLASVKNINPKAEIVGIAAAVPAYFSQQAHEELRQAFKHAGYDKELIALVPDRECVLANHYRTAPNEGERVLLLDSGSRELRGGLYDIKPQGESIAAESMSSIFDDEVGTAQIGRDVHDMFASFVPENSPQLQEHLSAFTYQNKDMLFQKNINHKPLKLYFNFVYPPFQQSIDRRQAQELIRPYAAKFKNLTQRVLGKTDPADIATVLCVGGGFEMLWAKKVVGRIFPASQICFYKNPKMIIAEGAALVAAKALDAPGTLMTSVTIKDTHQLTADIGLADGDVFLPLAARNSFWWQSHPAKLVLINRAIDGELNLHIKERPPKGKGRNLGTIKLEGLPARPKGTTRLEIGVNFTSNKELTLNITDEGFGDLFPQVEYERIIGVRLG